MATIKILTSKNILEIDADITFTTIEMPYGAKGFGFNGSSQAAPEELEKYWQFVRQVLNESNLNIEDYVTLLEINI